MTDTIEHFSAPLKVLDSECKLLKPNGILCVTTHNIESLLSCVLTMGWWGIIKAHLM